MTNLIDWDYQDPEEGADGIATMPDKDYKKLVRSWPLDHHAKGREAMGSLREYCKEHKLTEKHQGKKKKK